MQSNKKLLGFAAAIIAAMLWGVSGAFAQFLFTEKEFNAEWLVTFRLLVSGVLMLVYGVLKKNPDIKGIWKEKKDVIHLILFSVLGMLSVQYTYFVTILHSNAATATVLQYTGPVFITVYLALKLKTWPRPIEFLAIALAMLGTYLLVTHGDISTLTITPTALTWGLVSAIASAIYMLMPVRLLDKYSPISIIGWSMLIGGLAMSLIHPPYRLEGIWDKDTVLVIAVIVIFGTLIPFNMFLTAIKTIGPQRASLLVCAEPLSASLIAITYFGIHFERMDYIGSLCIIATILLLTLIKKKPIPTEKN